MKGGILLKVFAVLAVVIFASIFPSLMTGINSLRYGGISLTNFLVFDTVLSIAPTIMWLAGIALFTFASYAGYKQISMTSTSGFMLLISGVLEVVIFVTMFSTILTNINTVYATTNASAYIAFTTVVGIAPTILFLEGIGSGIFSGIQGGRKVYGKAKGGGGSAASAV